MTTDILVFRSVSVERLPGVLSACRATWPTGRLCVLTSANRAGEISSDPCVAEIISLPIGFADLVGPAGVALRARAFLAVVVPVGGQSAFGYGNLVEEASRLDASAYAVALGAGRLAELSRLDLWRTALLERWCLGLMRRPARWVAARWVRLLHQEQP
jgi:hypothetical protein